MTKNRINAASLLMTSVFFFVLGFALVLWPLGILTLFKYAASAFFILSGLFSLFSLLFRRNREKPIAPSAAAAGANIAAGLAFLLSPGLLEAFLPLIISIYIFFNSAVRFVIYFQYRTNGVGGRLFTLLWALASACFGFLVLLLPIVRQSILPALVGAYLILYSITTFGDFLRDAVPQHASDRIKRHIRISLPVFLAAFLPHRMLTSINRLLTPGASRGGFSTEVLKDEEEPDLEVLIHVAPSGVSAMGHMDIYFDNTVMSYGCYDRSTQKLRGGIGEGCFFKVENNKAAYIDFVTQYSNKTLFGFGLRLSEAQKEKIRKKLREFEKMMTEWKPDAQIAEEGGLPKGDCKDYASLLYKATKVRFFKFRTSRYKTYFVLNTNCVLLADQLLGAGGTAILKINGLITPGTYFDYLNREFELPGGMVISRKIYTRLVPETIHPTFHRDLSGSSGNLS